MKRILYSFSLAALVLASSCKKAIEIQPRQSVLTERALSTRENINAAVTGVYARLKSLRQYGRDLLAVAEAMSENGFATNKSGRLVNEAANVNGAHFGHWQNSYYAIAEINSILAAVPNLNVTPAVTADERASWEGQMYFLRALFYHDLARAYAYEPGLGVPGQDRGGIPIVTSTPLTIEGAVNNLPGRSSVDAVYARIYADLDSAIKRLPAATSPNVALANQPAAKALYTRVALYNRDYARVVSESTPVLTSFQAKIPSASDYVGSWTSTVNPESLFEIRFANQAENLGVNESLQTTYTTLFERGNPNRVQGFGDLVATTTLLQHLGFIGIAANGSGGTFTSRSDDVRNLLFERGSSARGTARIENTKFIGKNGFPNLDNIPVIRISEVLLSRAEARVMPTNRDGSANPNYDLTAARNDLVAFKQRRYSNYANTQAAFDATLTTQAQVYNEILRQRRLEFAMEGHRWFDFKRTGGYLSPAATPALNAPTTPVNQQFNPNNPINPAVAAPNGLMTGLSSKIIYTDFRILAPIPVRETDNNPNVIQNFGY